MKIGSRRELLHEDRRGESVRQIFKTLNHNTPKKKKKYLLYFMKRNKSLLFGIPRN